MTCDAHRGTRRRAAQPKAAVVWWLGGGCIAAWWRLEGCTAGVASKRPTLCCPGAERAAVRDCKREAAPSRRKGPTLPGYYLPWLLPTMVLDGRL